MKQRSSHTRGQRARSHPSVQALLNVCSDVANAEEAVQMKARELVEQARIVGWSGPPFDPFVLAGIRGIKVRSSAHPLRQDAFIHIDERGQTEIVWNKDRPPTRTRFSIGHEITHTFFPDCFDTVRNRACAAGAEGPKDDLERLCDIGAAELLMPNPEFGTSVARAGMSLVAVESLRELYEVSREAVCIRATLLAEFPCAVVFLSHRNKPTEVRNLGQEAFSFLDRPEPKLRVDFMVASKNFPGQILPRHKSIPDVSRLKELVDPFTSPGAACHSIESWPDVLSQSLAVQATRIPGSGIGDIRMLALLQPII